VRKFVWNVSWPVGIGLWLLLCSAVVGSQPPTAQELGAEFLYKRWDCEVDGNRLRVQVSAKVVVYSPRGADYGSPVVAISSFSKFKEAEILFSDTAGSVFRTASHKDLTRACGYGTPGLYDDICTYWLDVEDVAYPYVVEYTYKLEHQSLFFWRAANLQRGVPVKATEYNLRLPVGQAFHYKAYGLELSPDSTRDDGWMQYRWTATDLPARVYPDGTPSWAREYGRIEFIADTFELEGYTLEGVSWRSIGDWYRRMAADRYLPETQDQPVPGTEDARRVVEEIFSALTGATRYVSVQIGVGGWQPYAAEATAERGFGDCKDLTTLLVSRLRKAGIESYPVLIRTRDLTRLDPEFPTLRFNHVITVAIVGPDTLWMDPTCSLCSWDELPGGDEGMMVVVVTDSGGVPAHTPEGRATDHVLSQGITLEIADDLGCDLSCSTTVTGRLARWLRGSLRELSRDERAAFLIDFYGLEANRYELVGWAVDELTARTGPLQVTMRARSMRPLRRIGERVYVHPFLLSGLPARLREPLADRTAPIRLDGIHTRRDSIVVRWPAALAIDSVIVPEARSESCEFGSFDVTSKGTPGGVAITMHRQTTAYAVTPDDFATFTAYRDALVAVLGQYVKLCGGSM